MILVEQVSHAFDGNAKGEITETLSEVSLAIYKGELLSLIGPSGCGKTTLLHIIGGLIAPGAGRVKVDGVTMTGTAPAKIAFVFQENTLFPWNTVLDNIKVALEFQGMARDERQHRAEEALTAVGLLDFAHHYPHQLSGGMKQRASLARALSLKTDILLMDEPFAALDEQTRMYLGEELSRLLAHTGKTIVFVTHSLSEAVFLADRVAVLTARPARLKAIIDVRGGHPRDPAFMTSPQFAGLRNELYALLREEIQKVMSRAAEGSAASTGDPGKAP